MLYGIAVRLLLGLLLQLLGWHIEGGCAGCTRWIIAASVAVVVGVCIAKCVRSCHSLLCTGVVKLVGAVLLSGCKGVQRGLLLLLLLIRVVGGIVGLLLLLGGWCWRRRGGILLLLVILILASLSELIRSEAAPEYDLGGLGLLMMVALLMMAVMAVVKVRVGTVWRDVAAAAVMVVVMEMMVAAVLRVVMGVVLVVMVLWGSDTSCATILGRWWLMLLL